MRVRRRGLLLVLSSPSGAGKTTIAHRLIAADPGLTLSVSVTTRPPRQGEIDGRDYLFISPEQFSAMMAGGEFLEHAVVFGHSYGTPRRPIEEALADGRDIVGDVDWQGAQQLTERVRRDLVSVFVLPPSLEALRTRLQSRAQDSASVVSARMAKSAEETSHWTEYDYVIINHDIEESIAQAQAIVTAERLRRTRQIGLADFVRDLLTG
jgi:guanylate kinase